MSDLTPKPNSPRGEKALFLAALEIEDPGNRVKWVAEACGEDEALLARVEELLKAEAAGDDSFLEPDGGRMGGKSSGRRNEFGMATTMKGRTGAGSVPSIDELEKDFPELEIEEMIGRGGMGAVFKAKQASLNRYVALKVLPDDWNASESFTDRFEREAKTLAALNHPSIVTIHDFGERNGRYFFTMEFVDGTDLARMIQGGEMKPEMALELIPQICDAIQFAHGRNVVHRDIKPGNILVDREGRVKVADFGIAKLGAVLEPEGEVASASEGEALPDLTDPDKILGTPRYMAPEQTAGSGGVDHRADLYALGVVFYEMLVGSPPDEKIVPPSRQGEVDRRWDQIILRALEKDPGLRYQNASEIKTAVQSVLEEKRKLLPMWLKVVGLGSVATAAAGAYFLWPSGEDSGPLVNSLGMQFVEVPSVPGMVSMWETRVSDYEEFAEDTGRFWQTPPFEQSPQHPAVNVSWHDARAFCEWLTNRERESGRLGRDEVYRLPTDREWSRMARLPEEEGVHPQDRHLGQKTIYPWGETAPVPEGEGNYPDAAMRAKYGGAAVAGYEDGHAATAPVGSFRPTKDGLFDLGGNAWEWTATLFSPEESRPVLRGGGWWAREADDHWQTLLASSRRANVEATATKNWDAGFRVVRGPRPTEEEGDDLFRLVLEGEPERLGSALAGGGDANSKNRAGQPLLVLAADSGNLEMMKLLHEEGADLDKSDRRGRTALHAAAELGNLEMVSWLIEKGADARARTIHRREPLQLAARRAPVKLLQVLLEAAGPGTLEHKNSTDQDALGTASLLGRDESVLWLIEQLSPEAVRNETDSWIVAHGQFLAARDSELMSSYLAKIAGRPTVQNLVFILMAVINSGNEESFSLIFDMLEEKGLDQETMTVLGTTAVVRGRPWAIKALLGAGWDIEASDGDSIKNLLHRTVTSDAELRESARKLMKILGSSDDAGWMEQFMESELARWPPADRRETIRLLVEAGADIEARNESEMTPLIAACMGGSLDAVETLLDLGADAEARDDAGFTPLLCAVEQGHLEIVKELDQRGADFLAVNELENGVLHMAVSEKELLRFLLGKKDLSIDARNTSGQTPLYTHSRNANTECIAMLLEAGAVVNAECDAHRMFGDTPLHGVCRVLSEKEVAEKQRIHDKQQRMGSLYRYLLPEPTVEARLASIRVLLAHGADPKARNAILETPLHLASRAGLLEAMELFMEEGGDPNSRTIYMGTPLHFAVGQGQLEAVKLLLKHEAVMDNPSFRAPMATMALQGKNPAVFRLLLKHGMPLDRRDPHGAFPIHSAAYHGQADMLEIMLEAGEDPNLRRDYQYRTPLHVAASQGEGKIVELLRRNGARMAPTDISFETPAGTARMRGHIALAKRIDDWARMESVVNNDPRPETKKP